MLCAALLAFSAVSEAGSKPFNYTASGGFETQAFHFPDGCDPGESIALTGASTSGPITTHEWVCAFFNGNTCTVPGGVPNAGFQVTFADSFEVIHFNSSDLLVQNLVSGTACNDFSSGPPFPFDGTLTVSNVGGTGKFVGATGTETLKFAGQYLDCNNGCIGYVTQHETGTVTTP
jgi:hypothetical protein